MWRLLLSNEQSSAWAREARQRLRLAPAISFAQEWPTARDRVLSLTIAGASAKVSELVRTFPQQVRELAQEELLPAWALAADRGDPLADEALARIEALGQALGHHNGEWSIADTVAHWRSTLDSDSPAPIRKAVLRGLQAYGEGLAASCSESRARARDRFSESARALGRARSPAAHWAEFQLSLCTYFQPDHPGAFEQLLSVRHAIEPGGRYPALLGRVLWTSALTRSSQTDYAGALAFNLRALAVFKQLGEGENVAYVEYLVAENAFKLGQLDEAWEHRHRALEGLERIVNPGRRHNILTALALAAERAGWLHAALVFADELLEGDRRAARAPFLAEALVARSRILERVGRSREAEGDRAKASHLIASLASEGVRLRLASALEVAEAEALSRRDPARAVETMARSIRRLEAIDYRSQRVALHLWYGRAQRALGWNEEARRAFDAGLAELESQRSRIPDPQQRAALFAQGQELFEERIRLALDVEQDPTLAFELVERARARVLFDRLEDPHASARTPPRLAAQLAALPAGLVVLEWASLPDRLLSFKVDRGGIELRSLRTDAEALGREVEETRRALQALAAWDPPPEVLARLYDQLLLPWQEALSVADRVVLVASGPLHRLPFAALWNRKTGKLFLEEKLFSLAPSLATWLTLTSRTGAKEKLPPTRLLALGNPIVSAELFPRLAHRPLTHAEKEVRVLEALYPEADTHLGPAATKEALLAGARQAHVLHLATHALENSADSMLSLLLLSPSKSSPHGSLYSREIARLPLKGTRTVVLAACSTAEGRLLQGEGLLSLSRPFLEAGALDVVGTLWELPDDEAGVWIMTELHRVLRAGHGTAYALRDAQLAAVRSGAIPPRTWAAFEVLGLGAPARPEREE